MAQKRTSSAVPSLAPAVLAYVTERFPFALRAVRSAARKGLFDLPARTRKPDTAVERMRPRVRRALAEVLRPKSTAGIGEPTPGVSAETRLRQAVQEAIDGIDGCLCREAVRLSLTPDEKIEMLRGMIWTRAVDNRLKALFLGGEVRYGSAAFQGKGFRSLGQEAIYASALRLRRGKRFRAKNGAWRGDVVAPLIRDLGAALCMRRDEEAVRQVLSAQMAKAGPPMNGKDLHIGDFGWGVLPASAPLSISTLTATGMGMGFALAGEERVAVAYIGEGGSSLGEWHEAINLAASRRLPVVYCVQNNQTALSTPVPDQSSVRCFADKATGYGIPGCTVDGTDPEAIAAAFAWAADRARSGAGPALIETVSMRMCGHAHHDDMLYLGKEPPIDWDYFMPTPQGYADRKAFAYWAERDPIRRYAERLTEEGHLTSGGLEKMKAEAENVVETECRKVIESPWPDAADAGRGVFADEEPRVHVEPLADRKPRKGTHAASLPEVEPQPEFDPKGSTFLEAVMLGVGDAMEADERVFVYGQDVGGSYGNAFLLLRPLLERFGDRIINSTLAEGGILGVCVGAALAGRRPIGEIQFNDFVATGFNQLVNNAAKIRYRWGGSVPMVVRMPWGGLRKAGPYHSQNTEAWFYRTPGLKIVTPSTPHDARAMMAAAVADPDPVLYYEHIGLYRDPKIKQKLGKKAPKPLPIGRAAIRRQGRDIALISYGAYVHLAARVAETLAADGIQATVVDLRSVAPLDRHTILQVARSCGKVLVVHEDTRTGGVGESIAAIVQEQAFEDLDAPVRVIGALDTPAPYSPPLEEEFLPGEDRVLQAARLLAAY